MGKPIEGNNTNYTLGRPEWQQKWETKYQEFYTEKDLHNNREILNKPYLKPNYSGFEDPDNSWGFDCYNRDKDRKYIANRNMSYINTDYQKVWDPITNRFFYGTLQHQL